MVCSLPHSLAHTLVYDSPKTKKNRLNLFLPKKKIQSKILMHYQLWRKSIHINSVPHWNVCIFPINLNIFDFKPIPRLFAHFIYTRRGREQKKTISTLEMVASLFFAVNEVINYIGNHRDICLYVCFTPVRE